MSEQERQRAMTFFRAEDSPTLEEDGMMTMGSMEVDPAVRDAVRAVIRSSGSWTITPPCTPRTTVMRFSASRMRSASRSDGRETPNRSTSSGSRPSESPSQSLPLTIMARSSSAICCGFSRRRLSLRLLATT